MESFIALPDAQEIQTKLNMINVSLTLSYQYYKISILRGPPGHFSDTIPADTNLPNKHVMLLKSGLIANVKLHFLDDYYQ